MSRAVHLNTLDFKSPEKATNKLQFPDVLLHRLHSIMDIETGIYSKTFPDRNTSCKACYHLHQAGPHKALHNRKIDEMSETEM